MRAPLALENSSEVQVIICNWTSTGVMQIYDSPYRVKQGSYFMFLCAVLPKAAFSAKVWEENAIGQNFNVLESTWSCGIKNVDIILIRMKCQGWTCGHKVGQENTVGQIVLGNGWTWRKRPIILMQIELFRVSPVKKFQSNSQMR